MSYFGMTSANTESLVAFKDYFDTDDSYLIGRSYWLTGISFSILVTSAFLISFGVVNNPFQTPLNPSAMLGILLIALYLSLLSVYYLHKSNESRKNKTSQYSDYLDEFNTERLIQSFLSLCSGPVFCTVTKSMLEDRIRDVCPPDKDGESKYVVAESKVVRVKHPLLLELESHHDRFPESAFGRCWLFVEALTAAYPKITRKELCNLSRSKSYLLKYVSENKSDKSYFVHQLLPYEPPVYRNLYCLVETIFSDKR